MLLEDRPSSTQHVRATAGVNALEGVGIAEAPRGVLIHHYKVDEKGAILWANLIIATGHNNLAINQSIEWRKPSLRRRQPSSRKGCSTACRPWCAPTTRA